MVCEKTGYASFNPDHSIDFVSFNSKYHNASSPYHPVSDAREAFSAAYQSLQKQLF